LVKKTKFTYLHSLKIKLVKIFLKVLISIFTKNETTKRYITPYFILPSSLSLNTYQVYSMARLSELMTN